MIKLLILLIWHNYLVSCSDPINVTVPEQYAALLRTEDYIDPTTQNKVSDVSLFIGIFHVSVQPQNDGTTNIQITGVHQIAFATKVSLEGPKNAGSASTTPSIYVFASGGLAASSNSPFQATFTITNTVLEYLRSGLLYMQVTSGDLVTGRIRGQIQARSDLLINFLSTETLVYKADDGIALIDLDTIEHQLDRLKLTWWILSPISSGDWVATSETLNPLAPLGTIKTGSSLDIKETISSSDGASVAFVDVVFCNPNITTKTTNMLLTLQTDTSQQIFQHFIRLTAVDFTNNTKKHKK